MHFEAILTCESFFQTMLKHCCAHLISLRRCQSQMDGDGAFSNEIDFLTQYKKIKIFMGHQNRMIGSNVEAILLYFSQ